MNHGNTPDLFLSGRRKRKGVKEKETERRRVVGGNFAVWNGKDEVSSVGDAGNGCATLYNPYIQKGLTFCQQSTKASHNNKHPANMSFKVWWYRKIHWTLRINVIRYQEVLVDSHCFIQALFASTLCRETFRSDFVDLCPVIHLSLYLYPYDS